MKNALIVLLALGILGCASIPCAPPLDKPTCEVNYYIGIADQIDQNLQILESGVPLGASVNHAIDAYHAALPSAEQAAKDALSAYEAGTAKDYTTAMNFVVSLYTDINKVIVAAGQPNPMLSVK